MGPGALGVGRSPSRGARALGEGLGCCAVGVLCGGLPGPLPVGVSTGEGAPPGAPPPPPTPLTPESCVSSNRLLRPCQPPLTALRPPLWGPPTAVACPLRVPPPLVAAPVSHSPRVTERPHPSAPPAAEEALRQWRSDRGGHGVCRAVLMPQGTGPPPNRSCPPGGNGARPLRTLVRCPAAVALRPGALP